MLTNVSSVQDGELWRAFRQGSQPAFAQLYDRYFSVLYAYGHQLAGDEARVQDAIQDLFVDLWRTRERLSDTTSVKFYLFRALRRRLHQAFVLEQQFVRPDAPAESLLWPAVADIETEQIATETAQQQQQQLQYWLQKLPPRQLEVIQLRFLREFSFAQIAEIMAMNEQSVRNLLGRALHKLRDHLVVLLVILLGWYVS